MRELRPWLYSIARNAAIDQLRAQRGEVVELSPELAGGVDPAHVAARRDEVSDVLRAVSELPERQRTALIETAVHGRATEHVADEMGLSGGALRQLVHRARTSVRGMVASVLPTPLASWFAQTGGEEGTRRAASLLGGAGQGAAGVLAAATATVASVGAIGTGGITSLSTSPVEPVTRSEASAAAHGSVSADRSASGDTTYAAGGKTAPAIVRLPAARRGTAGGATSAQSASQTRSDDERDAGEARTEPNESERRDASDRSAGSDRREGSGGSSDDEPRRSRSHAGGSGGSTQPVSLRGGDRVHDQTSCRTDAPKVAAASAERGRGGGQPSPGGAGSSGGGTSPLQDTGDAPDTTATPAATPAAAVPAPEPAVAPKAAAPSTSPVSADGPADASADLSPASGA